MEDKNVYLGTKEDLNKYCLKKYGVDFATYWREHRNI